MTNTDIKNILFHELNRAYNETVGDIEEMVVELVHDDSIQEFIDNNDIEEMDIMSPLNDAMAEFFDSLMLDIEENEDMFELTIDMFYDKMCDFKHYTYGHRTNYDWD